MFFLLLRGCMILCVERLHDFCVCRGCVNFLTHSLRLCDLFSGSCVIFSLRSGCVICLLRDCVIYCVKRLHDFCVKRLRDFYAKRVFFVGKKKFLVKQFFE